MSAESSKYLRLRSGVWYFQKRIPKKAQALYGVSTMSRSLSTGDANLARMRRDLIVEEMSLKAPVERLFQSWRDAESDPVIEPELADGRQTAVASSNETAESDGQWRQHLYDRCLQLQKRLAVLDNRVAGVTIRYQTAESAIKLVIQEVATDLASQSERDRKSA